MRAVSEIWGNLNPIQAREKYVAYLEKVTRKLDKYMNEI